MSPFHASPTSFSRATASALCGAKMKHIVKHLGAQELCHAVRRHELWLASREQDGRQLRLSGVTISNHDLGGKRLSRAILEEVNFQDTSFRETQLGGSCLSLTNFDACDLGEARLSHAQLHEVRIHK